MSSDRNLWYVPPPPPPPPIFSILIDVPTLPMYNSPSCTVVRVVTQTLTPEEELLEARNRLWQRIGTPEPPHISCYRYITPILQDGPKCGLVALSMASTCTAQPLSVDYLFEEAKTRGYTNHGEMFSVDNMALLAADVLKATRCKVEVLLGGLAAYTDYVIQQIVLGSVLLIPYDADANNEPCCKRGHKAHWAVVSGVLSSAHSCHLVARQGKSRHLGVWSYEDVCRSNDNLLELCPDRAADGKDYVLPPGGVEGGLRGRAVMLHWQSD